MPESLNFVKKETLTQMFSCEFCETFKKSFLFCRTTLVAASNMIQKKMELMKENSQLKV